MNKFKAWLIHKLGGYAYLSEIEAKAHLSDVRFIYKELPCTTVNIDTMLPSHEWDKVISESEKIKIANREAADKIGRYIIENGLYEIIRDHNVEFDCEKIRYKIRVVQSPNPPLPKDHFNSIDEIHDDPEIIKYAFNFYGIDKPDVNEYVKSYDDPESFYQSNDKNLYEDYRQGKDGF